MSTTLSQFFCFLPGSKESSGQQKNKQPPTQRSTAQRRRLLLAAVGAIDVDEIYGKNHFVFHTITATDTIASVMKTYQVTVCEIRVWNDIKKGKPSNGGIEHTDHWVAGPFFRIFVGAFSWSCSDFIGSILFVLVPCCLGSFQKKLKTTIKY